MAMPRATARTNISKKVMPPMVEETSPKYRSTANWNGAPPKNMDAISATSTTSSRRIHRRTRLPPSIRRRSTTRTVKSAA